MIALVKHPHASQNDLVVETGIDKSTLKEMLGRMASKELVIRDRDPDDSRAWCLSLAPAGSELLYRYLDAIEAAQREILAPLPETERATFIRMLRILVGLAPSDATE